MVLRLSTMISISKHDANFKFETAEVALSDHKQDIEFLKRAWENAEIMTKRSKSDPRKEDEKTFLVTLFQVHYMEQFHQFLQCKNWSMESYSQIRQLLREEKINSQDAKMTLFLQQDG
jgi:hypothetical protein